MATGASEPLPLVTKGHAMTLAQRLMGRSGGSLDELAEQARKASDLLKALAHENRLLILCLLVEGERSVSELEDIMQMSQAAVSQQLARLRSDRLVNTRRDGRTIYYSIAGAEVSSLISSLYDIFCARVRDQQRAFEDL